MDFSGSILAFVQFFFAIVIGMYFLNLLRSQQANKSALDREAKKETERLHRLRQISLTTPLAEKTRPTTFSEIIGQGEGLKSLRAVLCGPNPQHVIIYGPPGVGKTAAARLVLEEAKKNPLSPFQDQASFVEVDATAARFDERGIADPLIGSVHDPIYQGAGPLGIAGIPQPKPGAVTKAHGGMLFLDEIGELHPVQLNKLLKVLEDRKVFLESAYYSPEDTSVPNHIHEVFKHGLPADFRLVGATTRMPQEISPAIRSRCVEIFFRSLQPEEVRVIAANAAAKIGVEIEEAALEVVQRFATNGREAVNMVQMAAGLVITDGRAAIVAVDMEWVANSGQYQPRPERRVGDSPQVGCVNGLAVTGPNTGMLIEVEAEATKTHREGRVVVTGVIEEEEMGGPSHKVRRQGSARGSVENVITVLRSQFQLEPEKYDLHINIPGGVPVDGPSAGIAMATAVYSAITGQPVDHLVAMTGEVSVRGRVRPVGGVVVKIAAAQQAGAQRVLIPAENWQEMFRNQEGIEVFPVHSVKEVIGLAVLAGPQAEYEKERQGRLAVAASVPATACGLRDHALRY
ncbi:MAG TPA: ATP-dependent protease LonB [Firmicutes bacterium]|jgi:Lon-like ATP-dependent protease|nr:ATP-dependent protease LonB [Bacillota bacterium]